MARVMQHKGVLVADVGGGSDEGSAVEGGAVRGRAVRGRPVDGDAVDVAVEAIRAGRTVILPTDTVYGLCADGYREAPALELFALKQRPERTAIALLASELEPILDAVPELRGPAAVVARALLPGAFTLVLPNPARRFRWLCGRVPTSIGIRVPELPPPAREVLNRVGIVAATSANLHGGPDPATIDAIPRALVAKVGAIVDVGPLPGTPSTVIDLTGPAPVVLREGAVPAVEALARAAEATR